MTENEAKEILSLSNYMKEKLPNLQEVYAVAVKALDEIQQYRSIGTVAECQEAIEKQMVKKLQISESNDENAMLEYLDRDNTLEMLCAAINDCENENMEHTTKTLEAVLKDLEQLFNLED